MVDNVAITAGTGTTVAADDIAGVMHQRVKISQGADGSATDVSSAAPLNVTLANTAANTNKLLVTPDLPTGASTAAKQPALGTAGTPSADVITVQGSGSGTALPVSFGSLAAGTNNIGDVDVLTVITGTGATNLGKAVDAVAGASDTGVAVLAIRDDALTALTPIDGDYVPLRVSSTGALHVTGSSGATEYTEDVAAVADPIGSMMLAVRRDTLSASEVSADGDNVAIKATSKGQAHVYAQIDTTQLSALGQTTMSASAPVAIASDQTPIPVVGKTTHKQVTLSLDTVAYASGDLLADTQQIDAFFRISNGSGVVNTMTVYDQDNLGMAFSVYLLKSNVSMGTENAAPSITDANALEIQGIIDVATTDYKSLGGVKVACIKNIGLPVVAVTGTDDIYVAVVNSTGAPTFTASGVKLGFSILQD